MYTFSAGRKEMKVAILLLFILTLPFVAMAERKHPWDVQLPFEKATVEYKLSGMEEGTETMYVRKFGKETAKYRKATMNMMGMIKVTETIEFVDQDWMYIFDLTEKSGAKRVNPVKYMIEEYNSLTDEEKKRVQENGKKMKSAPMLGGMSAKVEEKVKNILGYDCDRMTLMDSSIYTMHGTVIPLRSESNLMGMQMVVEATRVKENVAPDKYFIHPEGITPVMDAQADAIARSLAKETIASLKDPNAAQKSGESNPMMFKAPFQEVSPEEQQKMDEAMEELRKIFGN